MTLVGEKGKSLKAVDLWNAWCNRNKDPRLEIMNIW